MENELFFGARLQFRKKGEKSYGKGTLRITDQNVYINYKKTLGKQENYVIPKPKIETAELSRSGPDASITGPAFGANYRLWWYILDIKLKDGKDFQMYIGQPWTMKQEYYEQVYKNIKTIMQLLNPIGPPQKFPWDLD